MTGGVDLRVVHNDILQARPPTAGNRDLEHIGLEVVELPQCRRGAERRAGLGTGSKTRSQETPVPRLGRALHAVHAHAYRFEPTPAQTPPELFATQHRQGLLVGDEAMLVAGEPRNLALGHAHTLTPGYVSHARRVPRKHVSLRVSPRRTSVTCSEGGGAGACAARMPSC
jgi:hypothetical protein